MALGDRGPLALLADGAARPLLALDEAIHVIVPCGMNELALTVTDEQLHEGDAARALAEALLMRMARVAGALTRRLKLQFRVGLVAEHGVAQRFAQLDLRHHAASLSRLLEAETPAHYTPGVGISSAAGFGLRRRVELEGDIGRPLQWPCPSRVSPGELGESPDRLVELLMHIYVHTRCRELEVAANLEDPS